jgi:hypothetical protein
MQLSCRSLGKCQLCYWPHHKKKITSLSHSDDVPSLQDSWDGVGLHWCRILVATKVNIVDHNWVKARSVKLRWSVLVIEGIEANLRQRSAWAFLLLQQLP